MKLGLVADIHEHVDHLRTALNSFRREGVDQVVVLGDVFELGKRLEETCRLLAEARAIGVWGNHDFGLCYQPRLEVCQRYGPRVIEFMTSLRPRLEIGECLFTHVEPWLDPENILDLWYFEGLPNSPERLDRIFAAVPQRLLFIGHLHTWLLATPAGLSEWQGERPIRLSAGTRFFMVINALCQGWYALFDTETTELVPFHAE